MHLSKRNFPARVDYCFMSFTTMHWYPIIECMDATTRRRRSWACTSSSPPWRPSTSSPMLTQSRSPSTLSSTVWFSFEPPTGMGGQHAHEHRGRVKYDGALRRAAAYFAIVGYDDISKEIY